MERNTQSEYGNSAENGCNPYASEVPQSSAPGENQYSYDPIPPQVQFEDSYFSHPDNQFPTPDNRGKRKGLVIAIAVLILLSIGAVLFQVVFHIREISVQGAAQIRPEEIISLSGLREGQNTILVSHSKVAERLSRNRYIKFSEIEVHLPGTIVIKVKEREPRAYVCHNGFYIVIDSEGVILEEYSNLSSKIAQLVCIEGLNFTYPEIGTTLSVKDSEAMLACREIMVELAVKKLQGIVTEINISSGENIFLATSDGFSVRMGDRKRIHAKLEATKLVRISLLSQGIDGEGTIDVSNPEQPVYIPVTYVNSSGEKDNE